MSDETVAYLRSLPYDEYLRSGDGAGSPSAPLVLIAGMAETAAQRLRQSAAVDTWPGRLDLSLVAARQSVQSAVNEHVAAAAKPLDIVRFVVSRVRVFVMTVGHEPMEATDDDA